MPDYGITPQGPNIKRLDVILDEMHSELSEKWGVNTRQNPQSYLNVFLTAFGDKVAELWEFGQQIYQNYHPASAEDTALDEACQFAGVIREGAAKSVYPIHCTGVDGTVLTAGTILSSDTNPRIDFTITASKTIERASCNGMVIRVVNIESSAYTIAINQTLYTYTADKTTDDGAKILGELKTRIEAAGVFNAVVEEGEVPKLRIEAADQKSNYTILLTENLTTEEVTTIVNFQSVDYGDIIVPDGAISIITKAPASMISCINKSGYTAGQQEETDAEFRQSYASKVFNISNRTLQSVKAGILSNVDGVKSVSVYENDTNVTDAAGRPPHSVEVVVDGGDSSEIANQIWLRKAGGISTYGDEQQDIVGMNNETVTIYFNRPKRRYVWWRIGVFQDRETRLPSDYAEQITNKVIEFMDNLDTGDDVIPQRVFKAIYADIPGIAYMTVRLFLSESDSAEGPEDDTQYEDRSLSFSDREKATTTAAMVKVALDG